MRLPYFLISLFVTVALKRGSFLSKQLDTFSQALEEVFDKLVDQLQDKNQQVYHLQND